MPDPSPSRRPPRSALLVLPALAALMLAGLALGAWRLASGPVALPSWAVERVERRADPSGRLSLGGVGVAWDRSGRALRLRVTDAVLRTPDGAEALRLGGARVALDARALLRRRIRPRAVVVEAPVLRVARDDAGRVGLGLGPGGPPPFATIAQAEAALDAALARPALAALEAVELEAATLLWEDAVTGVRARLGGGSLRLARGAADGGLVLSAALPLGGGGGLSLEAERRAPGEGGAVLRLRSLSAARARALVPHPALDLLEAEVDAVLAGTLSAGVPGRVVAEVALSAATLTRDPSLAFDRASLRASWVPGEARVSVEEATIDAPDASAVGEGQMLLGGARPVVQMRLRDVVLNPRAMLDRQARFDRGGLSARVDPAGRGVEIGEAWLSGPSGQAHLSGRLTLEPEGPRGTLHARVPRMAVAELLALWPPGTAPGARRWVARNVEEGVAVGASGAARLVPGAPPVISAGFGIEEARVRFMRHLPPATGARGWAQLDDDRFALRVDEGAVAAEGGGPVAVGGTVLSIPDLRARPAAMEVDLRVAGAIPDAMRVLDHRPFRLLERMRRGPDLATGRGVAEVRVAVPLRPRNAPADVDWSVRATLSDVGSDVLVPGRRLSAERVGLTADAGSVAVEGRMALDGVAAQARFVQPLPPPPTEWRDPALPRPPPRPMPEGRVSGTARVGAADLAALGVALPLEMDGAAQARFDLALRRGAPPVLSVEADLGGAALALPAIGWRKARGGGALSLEAVLAAPPEIRALSLDAPGLAARGSVTLREGGGLGEARLSRVEVPWFAGPVTLAGRGAGRAPAVSVAGGAADLARALEALRGNAGGGGSGGGGGGAVPLRLRLDRLALTERIALTDLSVEAEAGGALGGLSGRFSGAVNGAARVRGVLAPDAGGTALRIDAQDAGAVLRAAGLVAGAVGGRARLVLRPGGDGLYSGRLAGEDLTLRDAPAMASLLSALSVVGLVDQLATGGLTFTDVEAEFGLRGSLLTLTRGSAVGPAMSITAQGRVDTRAQRMDLDGVVSPIYFVNGLFGALFSRRDEGLFGFTYRLAGAVRDPAVSVNPLSILTPGAFREIFRRPPPAQ